jgi:hypothetical protein
VRTYLKASTKVDLMMPHAGGFSSMNKDEHFNGLALMEIEETLMDKNGDVIASFKPLDLEHGSNRL